MEKLINSVGLSWLYDQIKLDLINIYNLLKDNNKINFDQQYKDIDLKICRIAKVFYLLEIPGGVFFINEFRLSLKYLIEQDVDNSNKVALVADLIEQLLNYIEDIIQGFGDLPIYYVSTIDQLRAIRNEILFSQCSYLVNSVKQYNISDFPSDYSNEQRDTILNSLNYVAHNCANSEKYHDHIISNISVLKNLFKGTQHYLLWDILEFYFIIKKNYSLNNNCVYDVLLKEIMESYSNVNNNLDFEKIAKIIPNWIAGLSFCLLYSSYFNILPKNLRNTITKMLNMTDKKSLNNYMAFAARMIDTDSCILLLDIASELDMAINSLQDARQKRRIDILPLLQLIQKQIDSCVLTGTYEPLEYYYNTVQSIAQYTVSGGMISADDLETIENHVIALAVNVEQSVNGLRNDHSYDYDQQPLNINESAAQASQDASNSLLRQQISELEEIGNSIAIESNLTGEFILQHLRKTRNIFNIMSFSTGCNIVDSYVHNLENNCNPTDLLSHSLRQNAVVFLKYLSEVLKSIFKNKDYSLHIKTLNNLVKDVALAGINNSIGFIRDDVQEMMQKTDAPVEQPSSALKAVKSPSVSLKQIFFEEFNENSSVIMNLFNKLKTSPRDANLLESLQRELHTLKGASRMVDFLVIGDWIHHVEELVNDCQHNITVLTKEHINILETAYNKVKDLISAYKVNIVPAAPAHIILQFSNNVANARSNNINQGNVHYSDLSAASFLRSTQDQAINIKPGAFAEESNFVDTEGKNLTEKPVATDELPVRTIPLRQNVRISKEEIDNLLDLSCELVIGQHQISQQNSYYSMVLNKLQKVTESMSSKSPQKKNMNNDIENLRNIIRHMQEIKTNYYLIVDNNDQNVNGIFNKLINLRMVPINAIRERLEHLAYSIANDLHKDIKFTINKSEGSIDRVILEQITPCLEHLIRNAIDHGVETPRERLSFNKDACGHIELNMYTNDHAVIIELIDDGAGIDFAGVKSRAVKAGIISSDTNLNDHNILPIITAPKFTTQDNLSKISGRGIGLNVVKETISQLCGVLEVTSKIHQGTKFTIHLPYSLAKQTLLFIKIMDMYYAFPSLIIDEVKKINSDNIQFSTTGEASFNNIPIYNLYDLLNFDQEQLNNFASNIGNKEFYNLVIINYKHTKVGIIVDVICEIRESVVRPLSQQLRKLSEFMGGTVYQDGRVVLILDIWNLISKLIMSQGDKSKITGAHTEAKPLPLHSIPTSDSNESNLNVIHRFAEADRETKFERTNILIVEDSATVRHSISNYLSPAHYKITEAINGKEGLIKIEEASPDLILLDIVMPQMNGIEFLKIIRSDARFKKTPVIIMTSRDEQTYKDIAMQLNVDVYLQKPYDQSKLINAINYVLEVD